MQGLVDVSSAVQEELITAIVEGEDIEQFHFTRAIWNDLEIAGGEFNKCIFEGVHFNNVHFQECSFLMATFIDCCWENCCFEKCEFSFSKLDNCIIRSTDIVDISLAKTALENVVIESSMLDAVDFIDSPSASLRIVKSTVTRSGLLQLSEEEKASYSSASFLEYPDGKVSLDTQDSSFEHFILLNFDFTIWENQNSKLHNLIALNSKAVDYDFSGVTLTRSQFTSSDMRGASFSSSEISQCSFIECDLREADFSHAKANYTLLYKANLLRSNFKKADLMSANLSQSLLEDSDFRQTNLEMTNFSKSDLRNSLFQGADMKYTDFSYANISGANFEGGQFFYSRHHAVVDVLTRYGNKGGIMGSDKEMLKADLWLMS